MPGDIPPCVSLLLDPGGVVLQISAVDNDEMVSQSRI